VAGSFKRADEDSGSIKCWEILSDLRPLKQDSVPWNNSFIRLFS
jgi:hypothetical protein